MNVIILKSLRKKKEIIRPFPAFSAAKLSQQKREKLESGLTDRRLDQSVTSIESRVCLCEKTSYSVQFRGSQV